jgi:hypothetical protein
VGYHRDAKRQGTALLAVSLSVGCLPQGSWGAVMGRPEPSEAPPGLREHGRALWAEVVDVYELTAAELRLLGQACQTLDVIADLEAQVAEDGLMADGSKGQDVLHPAVAEARHQRVTFGRLLGQLALPDEDGNTIRTPHQLRGRAGARARWGVA